MSERAIILYDLDCGFCRWALGKVLAWDRSQRLRPVPIQSPEGQALLDSVPEPERLSSWHLVDAGGELRSAGAAAGPLLRLLPGGAAPARLAEWAPGPTDRAYRWVASHRTLLGRPVGEGARRRADERIARRTRPQGPNSGPEA